MALLTKYQMIAKVIGLTVTSWTLFHGSAESRLAYGERRYVIDLMCDFGFLSTKPLGFDRTLAELSVHMWVYLSTRE
jgi:hypothetical protein